MITTKCLVVFQGHLNLLRLPCLSDRFLVYPNGNVAWTVSTFNITGNLKDGSPISGSGRNTLIWERIGNQWLIAHEHILTPLIPTAKSPYL